MAQSLQWLMAALRVLRALLANLPVFQGYEGSSFDVCATDLIIASVQPKDRRHRAYSPTRLAPCKAGVGSAGRSLINRSWHIARWSPPQNSLPDADELPPWESTSVDRAQVHGVLCSFRGLSMPACSNTCHTPSTELPVSPQNYSGHDLTFFLFFGV